MVEDRIRNIEARVRESTNLPESAKGELLDLLGALRGELQGVKREHLEKAEGIAGGSEAGHREAIEALASLEATHPRLAALANRLAVALANMGI